MIREIFIIGVGGQGALTLGELLCIAANRKSYGVSFYPFYGSQMRGGESGCVVKMDPEGGEIANPTINRPDDFLVLDDRFFEKYRRFEGENSKRYTAPAVRDKNLNLMLLKQYIRETGLFTEEEIVSAIREKYPKEAVHTARINAFLEA